MGHTQLTVTRVDHRESTVSFCHWGMDYTTTKEKAREHYPMGHDDWLNSEDWTDLVFSLLSGKCQGVKGERPSQRKLRLFYVAACRQAWGQLSAASSREAVLMGERFADLEVQYADMHAAHLREHERARDLTAAARCAEALLAASPRAFRRDLEERFRAKDIPGAAIARDIFGDPWHPCGAVPGVTPEAVSIAEAAYTGRADTGEIDPAGLGVLSDCLEEAGCTDAGVLAHLRSPGPHVRGCWVLDIITGRDARWFATTGTKREMFSRS